MIFRVYFEDAFHLFYFYVFLILKISTKIYTEYLIFNWVIKQISLIQNVSLHVCIKPFRLHNVF